MTHRLMYEVEPVVGGKDVGDNVFLAELSREYKVFAFYYPGAMPDDAVEDPLRVLGEEAGRNLFVNIARLNDPAFATIAKAFGIDSYPVIVVTGTPDLASPEGAFLSSFVRIDNPKLFTEPARLVELVAEVATMFLVGDVAKAIKLAERADRVHLVRAITGAIVGGLKRFAGFVADHDITVSIAGGKFELKKSAAT